MQNKEAIIQRITAEISEIETSPNKHKRQDELISLYQERAQYRGTVTAYTILVEYEFFGPGADQLGQEFDLDGYFEIEWTAEFASRKEALEAVEASYKGEDDHGYGYRHPEMPRKKVAS